MSFILCVLVPSSLYLILISLFYFFRFVEFYLSESTLWVTSCHLLRVICDWFSSSLSSTCTCPFVYIPWLDHLCCPEIGTSSIYWTQHSRCPFFTWWWRRTANAVCFLIKGRRWIMSKKFVILTTHHRHKPSELTYLLLWLEKTFKDGNGRRIREKGRKNTRA
jgi:hypothetical protein